MIEPVMDLHPYLRERLAGALESGVLALPCSTVALRSVLGRAAGCDEVAAALDRVVQAGVPAAAAAAWIRSLEVVVARARAPELVWTGLEVPGLHARDTRRVYEELIAAALRPLWASTYAYFDGPRAFDALA